MDVDVNVKDIVKELAKLAENDKSMWTLISRLLALTGMTAQSESVGRKVLVNPWRVNACSWNRFRLENLLKLSRSKLAYILQVDPVKLIKYMLVDGSAIYDVVDGCHRVIACRIRGLKVPAVIETVYYLPQKPTYWTITNKTIWVSTNGKIWRYGLDIGEESPTVLKIVDMVAKIRGIEMVEEFGK